MDLFFKQYNITGHHDLAQKCFSNVYVPGQESQIQCSLGKISYLITILTKFRGGRAAGPIYSKIHFPGGGGGGLKVSNKPRFREEPP